MRKERPEEESNPVEEAGKELHEVTFNLTLDLGVRLLERAKDLPNRQEGEELFRRVNTTLEEFERFDRELQNHPDEVQIHGFSRLRREDQDKIKLQPGEHAGVSVHIHNRLGETTYFNAYGGLRKPIAEQDMRDTDRSRGKLHSVRSDEIASHRTHLNMHMTDHTGLTKTAEVWIIREPNKRLKLSGISDDEGRIDTQIKPEITADDKYHEEYSSRLSEVLNKLVRLIPSQ